MEKAAKTGHSTGVLERDILDCAHYSTLGGNSTNNYANLLQSQLKMALVLFLKHAYNTQYSPHAKFIWGEKKRDVNIPHY